MRDQLGDHRIVIRRHDTAILDPDIDTHIALNIECPQRAGRRQETLFRVFGIQPRFDRMAVKTNFLLPQRQCFAACNPELPLDQIEASDRFRDGMLDLQPRIHFHEPERIRTQPLRTVGDELHRPRPNVANRTRGFRRRLAHDCA